MLIINKQISYLKLPEKKKKKIKLSEIIEEELLQQGHWASNF
jgi:hypothetical protein